MSRLAWFLPVVVLGVLVHLNSATFERGSLTFEEHFFVDEYGPSRGWPFRAYAPANDQGVILIQASVTGGGTVYRNVLDGRYPHLVVNKLMVVLDLLVAAALVLGAGLLARFLATAWQSRRSAGSTARRCCSAPG